MMTNHTGNPTTPLVFRPDGTFRILQFTDTHWGDASEDDLRTNALMTRILAVEMPDLVVFTGDTVYDDENAAMLPRALEPVIAAGVPWAMVFGNHDDECGVGKEELLAIQQRLPGCLTQAGEPGIGGLGNFVLPIFGSSLSTQSISGTESVITTPGETLARQSVNPSWMLYFIDSGANNQNPRVGGYDYVKRSQIDWYLRSIADTKRLHGDVSSLLFQHIALPEYNDVWNTGVCTGQKNEDVCCPLQNSGFFSAMLEAGTMRGVFVGHDHLNDFIGELQGIRLCFGRATGYRTYGRDDFPRGGRMILLREGQDDFETWCRLDDGTVAQGDLRLSQESATLGDCRPDMEPATQGVSC